MKSGPSLLDREPGKTFRLVRQAAASRAQLLVAAVEPSVSRIVRDGSSASIQIVARRLECRTFASEKQYLRENTLLEAGLFNKVGLQNPAGKCVVPLHPLSVRYISTQSALSAKQQSGREKRTDTEITTQEDPFDTLTDKIPVQPVSVAEGASYSVAILAGLAVAGAAAYTIFKELIVEPKEYKVYGRALDRVQTDMQIAGRLGSPIHGYGQESQNRAARQRISNRQWVDEDGVEHVEVMFYIRGPGGGGKVFCEMFKDSEDKSWKFTYLIVDVTHPTPKRFLLESYVPEVKVNLSPA
ncbi:hypothetical protein R1flu_013095 [Riccia fluitans]|uniref:Mitochondrial import inner membrane translocase subunit Tim21 n=1 Tax=Riccia fluitans TaxID=41844 RepID=A0ABD1ZCH2_9MARC